MKYSLLLFSFLLLRTGFAQAQEDSIPLSREINFLFHLGEQKQLDNLEYYSESLLNDSLQYSRDLRDSAAFATAELFNKFRNSLKARSYYDRVSDASVFAYPAGLFSGLLNAEEHRYEEAEKKMSALPDPGTGLLHELKHFELAGLYLLRKNHAAFDSLQVLFLPEDSLIGAEYAFFKDYHYILQTMKKKSGFLAGALSAVVPGLGKVYTGNPGQGLASFLRVVPLGLITAENFRNGGFKNAQFYIFGSLFTLFYVGNIWGSSLSAQIVYQEKVDEIHHNILVGLRIPVDRVFR